MLRWREDGKKTRSTGESGKAMLERVLEMLGKVGGEVGDLIREANLDLDLWAQTRAQSEIIARQEDMVRELQKQLKDLKEDLVREIKESNEGRIGTRPPTPGECSSCHDFGAEQPVSVLRRYSPYPSAEQPHEYPITLVDAHNAFFLFRHDSLYDQHSWVDERNRSKAQVGETGKRSKKNCGKRKDRKLGDVLR